MRTVSWITEPAATISLRCISRLVLLPETARFAVTEQTSLRKYLSCEIRAFFVSDKRWSTRYNTLFYRTDKKIPITCALKVGVTVKFYACIRHRNFPHTNLNLFPPLLPPIQSFVTPVTLFSQNETAEMNLVVWSNAHIPRNERLPTPPNPAFERFFVCHMSVGDNHVISLVSYKNFELVDVGHRRLE